MISHEYTKVSTARWGTDLVPYTTPKEKAMQSRFPQDYSCPLCNRRLVKPTVCFSCMHLIIRIIKAILDKPEQRYSSDSEPRYFRVTDKYVEEKYSSEILQRLEEREREQRKEGFLQRINNPAPKAFELEYEKFCKVCGLAIPYGLGHCEIHIIVLIPNAFRVR